jgi:hypothetical protein
MSTVMWHWLGDDLAEGVSAGGIEDLDIGETKDNDVDVGNGGELGQEPLRGTEEQRSVETVGDDVLVEESSFVVLVDLRVGGFESRGIGAGNGTQGEDRGDSDADLDGEDEIERDCHRGGDDQNDGVTACR